MLETRASYAGPVTAQTAGSASAPECARRVAVLTHMGRPEAVDAATMRVKGWDNLHVCGELLDVDGPVGGYNLQAAFSTGFVAGESV